ncbi:hypothetical protein [Staphylococcus phage PT94]
MGSLPFRFNEDLHDYYSTPRPLGSNLIPSLM